ncbi:hypothetical protein BAMBUS_05620 [Brevundimonas phage vB_BpoS-Bambus]|nr:hypothetical protein BAMBUS_05620 [Brevundimonas phage vB_BpoS-Bambus]
MSDLFNQIKARSEAATKFPVTLAEFKLRGDSATEPGAIVLRDFGPDHHDANRYVTHMRVDYRNQPRPGYSSGHYFSDLREAVTDYGERRTRNRPFAA